MSKDQSDQMSFGHEIAYRLKLPFQPFSWSFFLYFVFIVIGYGGFGIWLTIYNFAGSDVHAVHIPSAIGTYFLALWATSFFDLNTTKDIVNKKAIFNISVTGLGIAIILLLLAQNSNGYPYFWTLTGLVVSILYWIFVNADNESFYESYDERVKSEAKEKHGGGW